MPASIVELRSLVQSCALWMEEDKKFFKKTTPAFASCRVEETCVLNLFPVDVVVDISVFQQPDILGEGSTLVLGWIIWIWPVSEIVGMAIVPALHGLGCDPCIELLMVVVGPGDSGLVHQVLIKAGSIYEARGATSTVTGASICCWRC